MTQPGHEEQEQPEQPEVQPTAEPDAPANTASAATTEPAEQPAPEPGGPAADAPVEAEAAPAEEPTPEQLLSERTADLQRVQAEYVNYKRRVDRDRKADHERAIARVITQLLPVLDDIDRAREHGELDGGFKAVAESIEQVARSFGLESFGAEGEAFDPMIHEALHMEHSDEVTEPSVSKLVQLGYRIGDGVLRPARVLVVAPQD